MANFLTDANFAGNLTLNGTVDGRDVASDGSKLDGIASGATANTGTVTGTGNSSSVAVWTNTTNIIDGPISFSSNDATFAGDVTMTQSSGNNVLYINSSGGGAPVIYMQDPNRKWGQFVSNGHLYFKDETASVTALKIDGSTSNATFAGKINAKGGASITGSTAATINAYTATVSSNLYSALRIIDNTAASSYWDIGAVGGASPDLKFFVNASTTPKFTLSTAGNATFAGDVNLETGKSIYLNGTSGLRLLHDGSNAHIINGGTGDLNFKNDASDKDIFFSGTDGATAITALTLDMSDGGAATFNQALYIPHYIYHAGDTNTYFGFNTDDQFRVNCAGNTKFNVTSTQINTYSAEITTSGSPQYFTYGGSGSQTLVFRENGPGGYKNSIIASAGGGVQLFYNNSEKLVTQSGGVSLGNNSLFLGQYSAINLNGVGPSAGKVITGTGSSSQLTWNDSVSNITVGTGLDISSSTSNGAITKNLTLDFNELPVIDGDDPQADWFIVESSEDENSKINRSDLQSVDARWKTTQTILTSNFDDRSSSTSTWYMPLNYISETTSANYYNTFACPRGGTVKRIMMMHTAGSTMSTSFTTELSILKNGLSTSFSGELTPSNGSNDGSNITWSPSYTFTAGDRLNFRYQKSGTSKYWYGVSVSIIIEFDTI